MTISKEVKIGLLVIISVFVFFMGFFFLKSSNLFSGEKTYYGYFSNVQGLQNSALVLLNGVSIGKVSSIELTGNDKVKVELAIKNDIKIPKGSVAKLVSLDLLGGKGIRMELSPSKEYLKNNDEVQTALESGLVDNISTQINPILTSVSHVVVGLDTVLNGINQILNEESRIHLRNGIASLNVTTRNFAELSQRLNKESEALAGVIRNANSFMANLSKNNENIDKIVSNAKTLSDQLAASPLQETVKKLHDVAGELDALLSKINSGEGTVGMAVNDKKMYEELTQTLANMKSLMADIEAHPSRYINVTVFGRKQKN